MADVRLRRAENVVGPVFVDETCIDCDTCRWMAPEVFHRDGAMSAVREQPGSDEARLRTARAVVSCPTASIGWDAPDGAKWVRAGSEDLPHRVGHGVYHCGFHSESSFGAASWLSVRDGGNVLVDSPRFNEGLAKRIEALGDVRWMFLTHRDDVADHDRWADRLGCERVLHVEDVTASTRGVEVQVEGLEPLVLSPGLTVVPQPGHTKGHAVLHDAAHAALFTGDHLAWTERQGRLTAFRGACWYDWDVQTESMARLAAMDLEARWVLPGHGRYFHGSAGEVQAGIEACVAWMRTVA